MVNVGSRTQIAPVTGIAVGRMESKRIQLVIAHDCYSSAMLDHGPHDRQRFAYCWPTVYEVPKKDCCP
jgi:hypothetical protein